MISKLPSGKFVIGLREVLKGVSEGKIKRVVVAKNCPDFIIEKIKAVGMEIEMFEGNQKELGTGLGKPFQTAVVGYEG